MLFLVQLFRAVVKQGGPAGRLLIHTPAASQSGRRLLGTKNMGDPAALQHTQGSRPEILQGQVLQIPLHAVQPFPEDEAIDGGVQIFQSPSQPQFLPQSGRGDVHNAGQGQRNDFRPEALSKKSPLYGEQLLSILLAAPESTEGTQLRNLAGAPPKMEGEKHVRSHQQIESGLGVLRPQSPDGVQGVALPLPAQFHVRRLRRRAYRLGRQVRHGQPAVRAGGHGVHGLVGRNACGNQQQLIQSQIFHGEPRRLHVAQMNGIKGSAINSNFHGQSSFLRKHGAGLPCKPS